MVLTEMICLPSGAIISNNNHTTAYYEGQTGKAKRNNWNQQKGQVLNLKTLTLKVKQVKQN